MKPNLIAIIVGVGLLLAATPNLWALPPLQHSVSGIIKTIDYDAHTITVASPKGDKLVFVWKDSTRLAQGWSRICLGALEPGQSVNVHYRRELGQLVPRQVNVRSESPVRCTTGACCAKRS
jgi:hypothetical protein